MKTKLLALLLSVSSCIDAQHLSWAFNIGGQSSTDDLESMALAADGAVIVVGQFRDEVDFDPSDGQALLKSDNRDSYVAKYASDGALIWLRHLDAVGDSDVDATRVFIDSEGSILVTGGFTGTVIFEAGQNQISASQDDGFVLKYDESGTVQWIKHFRSSEIAFTDFCSDPENHYYFTGHFEGQVDFDPGPEVVRFNAGEEDDMFLLALDSDGQFQFAQNYASTESVLGESIACSGSHLYLAGSFEATVDFDCGPLEAVSTSSGSHDAFVLKLDLLGGFHWVYTNGGTSFDESLHLAIDSKGDVIVGGDYAGETSFSNDGTPTFSNIIGAGYVLKLSNEGDLQWVRIVRQMEDMQLDHDDNIYLSGSFRSAFDFDPSEMELVLETANGPSSFVQRLDLEGYHKDIWEFAKLDGSGANEALTIAIDGEGNIIVGGLFWETVDFDPGDNEFPVTSARFGDGFLAKLSSSVTSLHYSSFDHITAFPNPTTGSLTFDADVRSSGMAQICDQRGMVFDVALPTDTKQLEIPPGLPNGFYALQIPGADGHVYQVRFVLQR